MTLGGILAHIFFTSPLLLWEKKQVSVLGTYFLPSLIIHYLQTCHYFETSHVVNLGLFLQPRILKYLTNIA
jgi:hypothetical protein